MRKLLLILVMFFLTSTTGDGAGQSIRNVRLQCQPRKAVTIANVCFAFGDYGGPLPIATVEAVYTVKLKGRSGSYKTHLSYREEPFFDLSTWKNKGTFSKDAVFVADTRTLYFSFDNPLIAFWNVCEAGSNLCKAWVDNITACQKNPYDCKGIPLADEVIVIYTINFESTIAPITFKVRWK